MSVQHFVLGQLTFHFTILKCSWQPCQGQITECNCRITLKSWITNMDCSWRVKDSAIVSFWPEHGSSKGQVLRQDSKQGPVRDESKRNWGAEFSLCEAEVLCHSKLQMSCKKTKLITNAATIFFPSFYWCHYLIFFTKTLSCSSQEVCPAKLLFIQSIGRIISRYFRE